MTMQIIFKKNIQFTRLVKASGKLREFNFRKISADPEQFNVDVSDERGNRIMFSMQKTESSHWKIIEQNLVKWVLDAEKDLNDLILKELTF